MMSNKFLNHSRFNGGGVYAILIFAFTFLVAALSLPFISVYLGDAGHDSRWYIMIAEGHISEVLQPFSGRILYPFLAGWFDKILPLDIGQSFFILGIASLFLFLVINAFILKKAIRSPFLIVPILFLPYFIEISREFFVPDVFYLFLTALFFLFLFHKKEGLSLIVLFLLFLTRESTILLGVILMIFSLWRSKKALFMTTLVVVALSLFTTGQITSMGVSNVHNVGSSFYLVLKFSYNFLNNFLGIKLWASTLAENCEPIFRVVLPQWSVFGSIREAGLCGFGLSSPINSFLALITIFGVAPLAFFYIFFKKIKFILRIVPFWLTFAAIYGLAHYLIGVLAGTGVGRIIGYGWPAFLLATPFLIGIFFEIDKRFIIKLSLAQLLVAWLPFVIQRVAGFSTATAALSIMLVVPVYFLVFFLLKNQKMIDPAGVNNNFLEKKYEV